MELHSSQTGVSGIFDTHGVLDPYGIAQLSNAHISSLWYAAVLDPYGIAQL